MNWIDVLIVVVVMLFALSGWRRGFILGLFDLIGLVLGLIAAFFLSSYVTRALEGLGIGAGFAGIVAFILVFIAVDMLFWLLMRKLLRRIPEPVLRSKVNRGFGVLLGAAKGVLICTLAILLLVALPGVVDQEAIQESALGEPLMNVGARIEQAVLAVVPSDVIEGLTFITIQPQAEESIDIPKQQNVYVNQQAEVQMLDLVNQERTKRGLKPLRMDSELRETARKHSRDMFNRGYFSHVTPDNKTPFDRMRAEGVRFITAGENLAMAPTVQIAHQGLMQSPGHRANILNPRFGKVGIGVYTNRAHRMMFTQKFTN